MRGKKTEHVDNPDGTSYDKPGALSPEQVRRLIPKDILIFNWFWDNRTDEDLKNGLGEKNEIALSDWGFRQIFNNFEPTIADYDRRAARRGIIGGVPSSWAATNELNFGKDLMFTFLGCANLLWSTDRPDMSRLALMSSRAAARNSKQLERGSAAQPRLPGIVRPCGSGFRQTGAYR